MIQVQEARLRALGLDAKEATPGLIKALRPDCLGTWLPYALADILACVIAGKGGNPPNLADILSSWGLRSLATGIRDVETESAIDAMKCLAASGKEK